MLAADRTARNDRRADRSIGRTVALGRALLGEPDGGFVGCQVALVLLDRLVRVTPLPAHPPLGELLLELAGIEQDQAGELDRPVGRPDRPVKAFLDDVRNEPAMVEMGVGQQDRVELGRVVGERDPVPDRFVRAALEHPAVDEDLGPLRGQQELGAGDGRGGPEELEVHRGECATAPLDAWSDGLIRDPPDDA